jgi:hypothetical protein
MRAPLHFCFSSTTSWSTMEVDEIGHSPPSHSTDPIPRVEIFSGDGNEASPSASASSTRSLADSICSLQARGQSDPDQVSVRASCLHGPTSPPFHFSSRPSGTRHDVVQVEMK